MKSIFYLTQVKKQKQGNINILDKSYKQSLDFLQVKNV